MLQQTLANGKRDPGDEAPSVDDTMQGYLSDFWEQGMEEAPWLIFQDARYCAGPRGGWDREGLHRLGEGDRLTIFNEDGSVCWAGTITTRRVGWFSKLQAGSSQWYPEGMDSTTWTGFFRHDPPLKASYRPARSELR